MILTARTTVHDLLASCPELEAHVERRLPEGLRSAAPRGRAKWRRVTTLADVARLVNVTHPELLRELQVEAARLGARTSLTCACTGRGSRDPADESSDAGAGDVRDLLAQLESGGRLPELADKYRRLLQGLGTETEAAVDPVGAASPVGEAPAAGRSASVAREAGHPLNTLQRENDAVEQVLETLGTALEVLETDRAQWGRVRPLVLRLLELLSSLDRHYRRCVELVCPFLESHGRGEVRRLLVEGHRRVLALLADLQRAAHLDEVDVVWVTGCRLRSQTTEMVRQEEHLLLPLAQATLTAGEWREVRSREPALGWTLIDAPPPWPDTQGPGPGARP